MTEASPERLTFTSGPSPMTGKIGELGKLAKLLLANGLERSWTRRFCVSRLYTVGAPLDII